ncbi:Adhesion G-protein coupled receptor G2 [Pitangus sulphuratus]|nr:Adhesion G-protein coupled receptor G2 [Pitangus sulphuratus]
MGVAPSRAEWNTRLDYLKAKIRVAHTINLVDFSMNKNGCLGKTALLCWRNTGHFLEIQDFSSSPFTSVVPGYSRQRPILKPVKVPLDGIPSLRCVDHTTQLGVVGKLDQEDFLGRYKAVFKTACEDPWIMSSRISLHPLKEFLVCVDLKLYSSHNPWIAYVYTQEAPHTNVSTNKYDLGLGGDRGKLSIWLFGNQINKTARLHENTWNQICIQWKSDNEEMKVFINGTKRFYKKLRGKVNLPGKGQFLLGCSKLRGAAASPNQGMTGEVYMFRMWDKANITQSEDCQDSGVIGWRKEDWTYTTTVEEDNSLPCDMSSEETTQSAVFYVGKVKLKASEESNTSLSVEIINNITTSSQVRKLITIPASAPQELSIHCKFIMKLAERENISSLTNKAKISQLGFTKHSALSSSELPHKLPIVNPHFETITKSVPQIPPATTHLVSGNKNVSTVPILPLTPFTISLTPTVSPVNHSVSASRPHSTVDGHGSTGKTPTTNTTSVYTTMSITTAEQIVSKIENDLAAGKVEPKDVERMVNEVSSVLTASQPLPPRISKRIIKLVDYIGLKLKLSTSSAEFVSPSLALAVVKTNNMRSNEMSFAVQDSADLQISLGVQAINDLNNLGSITLPSSLLTNLPTEELDLASRIIFNFFKKTTVFQDLSLKNASLISNVISSSVANLTIHNLKANVTVTLQNIKPNQNLYGNTPLNPTQELVLTFISYIGCGLSAIFLSVTLVTYIAFEKIRRDYPSKILIQLCAALLLLNLVFLLDSWIALYDTRGLCIAVAVFLHYFLLVSFTWMGLEAFHMYLALVKVFNTYVRKYILKFCVIGWGLPALVVSVVLAISPDNYGLITTGKVSINGPDEFCWIKNRIVFYITAVGYFCLIFLINISMFIVVLIQLCRIKKKKQLGAQRKTSIQDLRSVAGLTFLLGITWGFAFFTVNEVFTYLFTIFNTLQGFFIFIFYCVTKENVRKQWRRYLCCGKFRLAENSDWSRTATNGLKKQTVNQGVSSSSNSLQSNSNSTNSTTLLMNNDYSVHANGNGHLSSEKNGVPFSVQNGDVCLHDFSGKQLVFQDKDDTGSQESHISLRRTSKRGSLNSMEKM